MSVVAESNAGEVSAAQDWPVFLLGEICRTTSGGTPSRSRVDYFVGEIPWVKSGELTDGLVSKVSEFISEEAVANSSAKVFPSGTLLIAMYGATVGKLGILTREAATNQAICAIFPPPELNVRFVFWYLRRQRSYLIEKAVGGAQPNISQTILRELRLPLPPLAKQLEIVAEIEKQFSRLDEAVANLQRVKANLKRYKAAVLKAAVEGRLVETEASLAHREDRSYETGERLLNDTLVVQHGLTSKKSREPREFNKLAELPEGWFWSSVGDVGRLQLGRQRAPKYHTGANMRPYLRVQNVFEDRIDLSDVMEMEFSDADFDRFMLRNRDVLLNEGQSPEFLGRPAIYRGQMPGVCFTNTLIRFQAHACVLPEFALIVFRHCMHSGRFAKESNITTNIAHLSLGRLATVEFPLPPLAEQDKVVAEVERQLSIVREVEVEVGANLQRAQALRQATLARCFSGESHAVPD